MISNGRVLFGGMVIHFSYDRGQLLQARNEYNKAAVLTTTLDEYKQVLDPIPPERNPLNIVPEEAKIRRRT